MAFNSTDFVFFLVAVFALFWRLVRWPRWRWLFLLFSSYLFYAVWNGALVGLILFSSVVDFVCGGIIASQPNRPRMRKLLLFLSIFINLGLLGYFKYTNFFIENAAAALEIVGISVAVRHLDILLPVGISFYTFQSLSYTIDVYRGALKPARSLTDLLLFVSFFPQLIAGPIVRAREFLPQLEQEPELTRDQLTIGCYRLMRGFVKKMVVADYLAATIVDPYFRAVGDANGLDTLLALTAFHFQVYCDFSGYTDIAIGSAALLGFTLPENFRTPYAAHTPAAYWGRWHMTLSRFCFDYLYLPLGGNRCGRLRTHLNTMTTFALIGFWHGASWTFVLFGVYHAIGVIGTRIATEVAARLREVDRKQIGLELEGRFVPILLTNLFIIGSLALFRSPDIETALLVYSRLLQWDTLGVVFSGGALAVLFAAIASHYVPDDWEFKLQRWIDSRHSAWQAATVFGVCLLVLRMAAVAQQSFVYFRF